MNKKEFTLKGRAFSSSAPALILLIALGALQASSEPPPRQNQHTVKGLKVFENSILAPELEFLASSRKSLLAFKGKSTFLGSYGGGAFGANVGLSVVEGTLLFNGSYNAARSGGDKGNWMIGGNSTLSFGPQAQVNQQMKSMIMARPIFAIGRGKSSILEFDPRFKADHMGWPDLEKMTNNGFSVLYVQDATMVTHHTQSLPSVHKFSGNGNHTHHGVLVFKNKSKWEVKSSHQIYDGVLAFHGPTEIMTDKDLLFIGHYFEDSHCYFGSWGNPMGPPELIKTGTGRLVLMGTQLYADPFVMRVREGMVAFRTQTAHPGQFALAKHPDKSWDHLRVNVEKQGTVLFHPPLRLPTILKSLDSSGKVVVMDSPLTVRGDMSLHKGSTFQIKVGREAKEMGKKAPQFPIKVEGDMKLGGRVEILGKLKKGRYLLARASSFKGEANWVLPEGSRVEKGKDTLRLIID